MVAIGDSRGKGLFILYCLFLLLMLHRLFGCPTKTIWTEHSSIFGCGIKRMARKWKSPTTKRTKKKFLIFSVIVDWQDVNGSLSKITTHTRCCLLYLSCLFSCTRIWKIAEQHFMAGLFSAHATSNNNTNVTGELLFRLQNANGNNIKYMHWQCGNFMVRKVYAYTHTQSFVSFWPEKWIWYPHLVTFKCPIVLLYCVVVTVGAIAPHAASVTVCNLSFCILLQ